MVRAAAFFLALEASVTPDKTVDARSMFIGTYRSSSFPTDLFLTAVFLIDVAPEELGMQHELRLELRNSLGERVDQAESTVGPFGPSTRPDGHDVVSFVVPLNGWRLPGPGEYSVSLAADGDELASEDLTVELLPATEYGWLKAKLQRQGPSGNDPTN
jgi:uncharacterized protein DUF6941